MKFIKLMEFIKLKADGIPNDWTRLQLTCYIATHVISSLYFYLPFECIEKYYCINAPIPVRYSTIFINAN